MIDEDAYSADNAAECTVGNGFWSTPGEWYVMPIGQGYCLW